MIFLIILYGLALLFLGSYTLFKWKWFQFQKLSKRFLVFAFLFKVVASFGLISLYTYYYKDRTNADIYKYFDDGKVIANTAVEAPVDFLKMISGVRDDDTELHDKYYSQMNHWTRSGNLPSILNDNRTIIRTNAIMHLVSFNSIWIHGIFFAWLSTIGLLLLLKAFEKHLFSIKVTYFLLLIAPSIALWFSGPLKESILFLGLGLFFYGYLQSKQLVYKTLILLAGTLLLINTKMYLFPIILVFIVLHEIINWIRRPILISILFTVIMTTFSWMLDGNRFAPAQIISTKQTDFINLAKGGFIIENKGQYYQMPYEERSKFNFLGNQIVQPKVNLGVALVDIKLNFIDSIQLDPKETYQIYFDHEPASSYYPIQRVEPNTSSLLKAAPSALFNSIARPLPKNKNPLQLFNFVENIFYLIIIVLSLKSFNINKKWPESALSVSLIVAGLLVFLLIGYTTPVAGAIVRYKVPGLIFFILAFSMNEFSFLKRFKI